MTVTRAPNRNPSPNPYPNPNPNPNPNPSQVASHTLPKRVDTLVGSAARLVCGGGMHSLANPHPYPNPNPKPLPHSRP